MARSSNNGTLLLLLLGVLVGGGTWNYMRNLELEKAQPRTYRGYSMIELETLRSAYQGEVDTHSARYRAVAGRTVTVGGDGSLVNQVSEFERVQRIGQSKRAIAGEYAKNQVRLDEIDRELSIRANEGTGVTRILRLATKYP